MAFPVVQATATGRTTASNTTSHAITLPASIVAGELLLVVFSTDQVPTVTVDTGASGVNWTKLGQSANGSIVTGAVFWKIAEGSDVLTLTTSTTEQSSHISMRISGAINVDGVASNGSSTNSNPPSHTTAAGDNLWVATRSGDSTVVATVEPSTFTNLETIAAAGTGGASTNTARLESAVATVNPGVFTSASEQWVSYTLAVNPSTGATGTGAGTAAAQTASGSGIRGAIGTGAGTVTAQIGTGTGTVIATVTGSGAGTASAQTATGTGIRASNGTGAGSTTGQTGSGFGATGSGEVTGSGSGTVAGQTGSGAGFRTSLGTGAGTTAAQTGSGLGLRIIEGGGTGTTLSQLGSGSGIRQSVGSGTGIVSVQTGSGVVLRLISGSGSGTVSKQLGSGTNNNGGDGSHGNGLRMRRVLLSGRRR